MMRSEISPPLIGPARKSEQDMVLLGQGVFLSMTHRHSWNSSEDIRGHLIPPMSHFTLRKVSVGEIR